MTKKTARALHTPRFHLLDRRADEIAEVAKGADPEQLLTTKEVSGWLRVSEEWLEIGRSKKYGPPFKRVGTRKIFYSVGDVREWLKSRTHASTAEYGEVA